MPQTTATNPQTNETVILVDGAWKPVDKIATNPADQSKAYLVGGAWLTDTGKSDLPVPKTGAQNMATSLKSGLDPEAGVLETGAHLATGAAGTVAGGLAGLAAGAVNTGAEALGMKAPLPPAADVVGNVSQAMTYQPRTDSGKAIAGAGDEALSWISSKPGNAAGEHVADLAQKAGASPSVSAALGAGANTAVQFVPQVLLGHGLGAAADAVRGAGKAGAAAGAAEGAAKASGAPGASAAAGKGGSAAAADKAKAYVADLGLDWGKLGEGFKNTLAGIAESAGGLEKLNPASVKRQGVLAEVGIDNPTRGQVTRDPLQQRSEQGLKATEAGKPLQELDLDHNAKLLEGVANLRAKVTADALPSGSKAAGDLPVGRSVQDTALRTKAAASEARYNALYKKARKTEPDATAPADPLYELLGKNPHIQHLGWVDSWLKRGKVETVGEDGETRERRGITLNELNDLRSDANGVIRGGGTDAHYAAQVKQAIDSSMETVPEGAKAWKEAIGAYRKHQQEFADQGAVRGLVEDKPHSSDRRVAIEETAQKTVTGRLEDLQKVKRSLLTGSDAAARRAGKVAWRDLKGWGIDHIRERMTKGTKNERGDGHATWVGLKRGLDDIGDANLDELYGPTVRKQLRKYQEAAEILWTESSTRVKGSPTFDKLLTFLDRIGNVPGLSRASELAGGVVKTAGKVMDLGKDGREVRAAQRTPLDDQLTETRRDVKRRQNLSTLKRYGGAATATDQGEAP